MKYLLVLIVVMVGIWVWRSNRAEEKSDARDAARRTRPKAVESAVDMGECDMCGLHCPSDDLIVGRKGRYCSVQHRNQAES